MNMQAGSRAEKYSSRDYRRYKEAEERTEDLCFYEKACKFCGKLVKVDLGQDLRERYEKNIRISRLEISSQEIGGALILPTVIMAAILLPGMLFLPSPVNYFMWAIPGFWIYYVLSYPSFRAKVTKIKSSDEALRIILYMAMHLDINPSLEGAIKTAAEHSNGPIGKDFTQILWKVEIGSFTNIKKALGDHVEVWREWSTDFVKSLEYLVNSVSRVGDERRRMIQKAQDYIIESTRSKMEQYSRDLATPVKVIHMMGIMLPIMGLIMFPMISIFLQDSINPAHLAFGYVVVLPLILFFAVYRQVAQRPGAYSHPSLENVPNLPPKYKLSFSIGDSQFYLSLPVVAVLIGGTIMIPGVIHYIDLIQTYMQYSGKDLAQQMMDYYHMENLLPSLVQGMTVIWGILAGLIIFFEGKSRSRRKIREKIERIEGDLDIGLTELENSLAKNIPIERALYDVIEEYEKMGEETSPMHDFFSGIIRRIEEQGQTFKKAIFDEENGAIQDYPSALLRTVMRIVTNSISKGTRALISNIKTISGYIKNSNRVEELIKGMLDEVLSNMKMLAGFIAPMITAVAASMSSVIVVMLVNISKALQQIEQMYGAGSGFVQAHQTMNSPNGIIGQLTNFGKIIPSTVITLIVGLYMIEAVIILAYFINGIEHGFDEINRDTLLSRYLLYAGILFSVIVLIASVMFLPFIQSTVDVSSMG